MAFNSFNHNIKINNVKTYSASGSNRTNKFKDVVSNIEKEIDYSNYESGVNNISVESKNSNLTEQNRKIISQAEFLFTLHVRILSHPNFPNKIVAPDVIVEKNANQTIIKNRLNNAIYRYRDGLCYEIEYENGIIVEITYDSSGEAIGLNYVYNNSGKRTTLNIFGDYNIKSKQYGGDQGVFENNTAELLQDPIILDILRDTYPEWEMEDYEMLLKKINSVGCGYVAVINSLFVEYEGREEEFEEAFGFPMYSVDENGNINYNYEYLILEYILYRYKDSGAYSRDGTFDNSAETVIKCINGFNSISVEDFEEFLHNKSIEANIIEYLVYEDSIANRLTSEEIVNLPFSKMNSTIAEAFKDPNKQVILSVGTLNSSGDFDDDYWELECIDSTFEDGESIKKFSSTAGHAMYLVGLTETGDYIVSTWGYKCLLRVSDPNFLDFYIVSYN